MKEGISIRRLYIVDDADNLNMATLAIEEIEAVVKNDGQSIKVGVAVCSPKDKPNKRLGAEIATGRLLKDKCVLIHIFKGEDFMYEIKKRVASYLGRIKMYHLPNVDESDMYTKTELMATNLKHKLITEKKKKK